MYKGRLLVALGFLLVGEAILAFGTKNVRSKLGLPDQLEDI